VRLCYFDAEFYGVSEPELHLVSVAVRCTDNRVEKYVREFWLHQGRETERAKAFFRKLLDEGYTFVGYTEAEPRSLLTLLGDGPWARTFRYLDLYLEYRCLLNHSDELSYGRQYIDGEIITTTKPPSKWERVSNDEDEDDTRHHKPQFSLAAATFKLLGEVIDTAEKKTVRDIIIASDPVAVEKARERIQRYNMSDIVYLPRLLNAVASKFNVRGFPPSEWLPAALKRGEFSLRTGRMVRRGYPVNVPALRRFTENTAKILTSAAEACNAECPADLPFFRWDKRLLRYSVNQANVKAWVKSQGVKWRTTPKTGASLSKDAFADYFDSTSEGPGGAFYRFLKTKQSLNGFLPVSPKAKRKASFYDYLGSDGRVRTHLGMYGSATSRSQPKATGHLGLKAHWMRVFLDAGPGRALCGLDYASQEFLIAAVLSQDHAMMDAYESGDVYIAAAIGAGLVPKGATKASHPKEREWMKTVVLGVSYDMGASRMASTLTVKTGEAWTEDRAEAVIDGFYEAFPDYAKWKQDIKGQYLAQGGLSLPDGWLCWGDNDNLKSVGNFPVQGTGAVILRRAVALAQDFGLDVVFTLHDAVYMELPSKDVGHIEALRDAMLEAFFDVLSPYGRCPRIRIEGEAWSTDYRDWQPPAIKDVVYLPFYVDAKGKADLERYRQFFSEPTEPRERASHGIQESFRDPQVLQV
jgi:DNA polymerase-1